MFLDLATVSFPRTKTFADADIDEILRELTDDEKIALLGAPDWWRTNKIDRLGVPPIRMSDGPNGVRGTSNFLLSPSQCIPSATSLGATFDTELIEQTGAFLASEAKLKAITTLLAPTCNIQRNPLGGRAFESFSEDPYLSGSISAAYVNGLQKNGVASAIKHFVCNDSEHERTSASSEVSPRALREIYLYPFMIAQRDAKPLAYMTSYGRLNGVHVSENPILIGEDGILRKEWGFKGLIMSDWYGTYGLDAPIKAGLDLEMPGPPRWRSQLLVNHTLSCQKLFISDIDKRVRNVLEFAQRLARISPEVVFADGAPNDTVDRPEIKAFNRKLASEGMVLLRNNGTLPLKAGQKIAVIGPNAKSRVISGGGSAFLKPSYVVTPWEGLRNNAPEGTELSFAVGCYSHRYLPTLDDKMTTLSGQPGWEAIFYDHDAHGDPRDKIHSYVLNDTRVKLNDYQTVGLTPTWTIKFNGLFIPDESGPFEFGLIVCGKAKLWVDGKLIIDNWTKQRPGNFFYGSILLIVLQQLGYHWLTQIRIVFSQGTCEEKAIVPLTAGEPARIDIEYINIVEDIEGAVLDRSNPAKMLCVRLGGAMAIEPDEAMQAAVDLAKGSDVAVVVAGLTSEWEAEGADRPTMDLPARQHELIQKVIEANPRTVVVIQAGSATSMPYAHQAAAVIQAWYSGNEVGNAIADVLFGKHNPSGKLPISFPAKIEDIGPASYSTRCENGKITYREDLFVGYKHYASSGASGTPPLFAFGYGLSYSTFSISDLKISAPASSVAAPFRVSLSVVVTNTGSFSGSEVVQAYISLPKTSRLTHPKYQLRAFTKVKNIAPGETRKVDLLLNKYAVSYWDDSQDCWVAEKGEYTASVGTASNDLPLRDTFYVNQAFTWTGL
ncbi:hypothetical protein FRB96_009192 [Tulasnella sp. 330]|nr:hypothetical protein FRB96_009192 [Tulasnella sp. 330]